MADAPHASDAPNGYRPEARTVYVQENSDFSDSRRHEGLKSGLARDRETSGLSHVLIGDRIEPAPEPEPEASKSSYADDEYDWDWDGEGNDEGAPDISRLIPLALVAAAGIAAGVAGANRTRSASSRRARRPQAGTPSPPTSHVCAVGTGPHGPTSTRNELAPPPAIAADWYPDPSNAAQLRYWDGTAWTGHVSARPSAVTTPADWYPDPSNAAQRRYWDGRAWTQHVSPLPGTATTSAA